MSKEEKIKYKELCTKRIGDMEKDETIIFVSGLLDEIWDLENKIDKATEVLKEIEGCDAYIKEVLEILREKENE